MAPRPNVASGDFDGNGETDGAVLADPVGQQQRSSEVFVRLRTKGAVRLTRRRQPASAR
jgi:hypothetical protein